MKWLRANWLFLLAFTLPFERIPSYDLPLGPHTVTIRASFIIALVVVIGGIWHVLSTRKFKPSAPDKWLLAYVLVMIASMGESISRSRSLQVIFATVLVIGMAMVIERTLQRFSLSTLYRYLLATTLVCCLFGLYQFIGDSLGIPVAFTGLKVIYTKHVFGFPRIQSVSLEPLFFASFLLLPISLLLGKLYTGTQRKTVYVMLGFVTFILALTLSRGGIYGALGGLVVLAVLLRKQGSLKRLAAIVVTMAVGIVCAIGLIGFTTGAFNIHHANDKAVSNYVQHSTTLTSGLGAADNDRSVNSSLAIQAFRSHPFIGVGIGNFGYYAQLHDVAYAHDNSVVVNNEYFEILAETGIVGLLSLLGFVVALLYQIFKAWPLLTDERRIWVGALCAALFGAAIQYYSVSTLYIIQIWFAIGLLLALTRDLPDGKDRGQSKA